MIYFYTEKTHEVSLPLTTKKEIIKYCSACPVLGLDCEFNSLDSYKATLLLLVIGDTKNQFVIDATSVDISFLRPLRNKLFVGHNIKIDYKISKVNGFEFRNVYDTMIAEQRLGLGAGRQNSLDAVLERRLDISMSKDIRKEFIKMTNKSTFYDKHIKYAADDIQYLERLMDVHKPIIHRLGMAFLLYDIEFPLIPIMGDCDLEGFIINEQKWRETIKTNKETKNQLVDAMDSEVKRLIKNYKPELSNTKYNKERIRQTTVQKALFDEDKLIEHETKNVINYTSSTQIKKLFSDFGETPPERKGKVTVAVPTLNNYLLTYPQTKLYDFIKLYINYSAVNKELNTYGEKFLDKINSVTGKLHTVYRHCSTDTGRFSSGDTKAGFPNMQNIPASNKVRHCFGVEEGYEVTTCDLSGAELIVMVALSGDLKLLKLASGDMHSHMANVCWERIYQHRGLAGKAPFVSKNQNKDKRTEFKPMTFGTIYGMRDKKAAEQLNVSREEGKIVVETIREEIPDVFTMVENAARFAIKNGYVVHNTRTNSRRWFTPVLDAKKHLKEMKKEMPLDEVPGLPFYLEYKNAQPKHLMHFIDVVGTESAARNTRIQGTQADMIKEAIVELDKEIKAKKLDLTLLGTVHDELIYKHPVGYTVGAEKAGAFISRIMRETANKYLDGIVEMKADYETTKTWTK